MTRSPEYLVEEEPPMAGALDAEYVEFISARIPQLRRAARLLCGDLDRGDDIVQRAITDAYLSWARMRRADNPDALLRRILMRRFLDERRLRWSSVLLTDTPAEPRTNGDLDPAVRLDLHRALMRLGRGQRAVVVLRYFYDMSVEETAQCLGRSAGTIKSQAARGLANLRTLLDASNDHDTPQGTRNA